MDWLLIIIAGFSAGVLNAIAGGGSFITLPALSFIGLNPIMANATGTAALLPGYIASAWRFRKDIKPLPNLPFVHLFIFAILGGACGALLLLVSEVAIFSTIIPWLILFASLLFLCKNKLSSYFRSLAQSNPSNTKQNSRKRMLIASIVIFSICLYGGYFNGGIGVILLAALSLLGLQELTEMNALKNLLSAVLTIIAVLIYIIGDQIEWFPMLIMSISSSIGGYLGASLAYKINNKWIVSIILSSGFISFIYFL
jgi:uncharacterized membrane protein YfcA